MGPGAPEMGVCLDFARCMADIHKTICTPTIWGVTPLHMRAFDQSTVYSMEVVLQLIPGVTRPVLPTFHRLRGLSGGLFLARLNPLTPILAFVS